MRRYAWLSSALSMAVLASCSAGTTEADTGQTPTSAGTTQGSNPSGGGSVDTSGASTASTTNDEGTADGTTSGGAETTGTSGDPWRPVPQCLPSCTTVDDCVQLAATHDADNFQCDGGGCRWQGCNDDAECQDTFQDPGYVCRATPSSPLPQCLPACVSAQDCAQATPLYDADNWECNEGACHWSGCNADAECQDTFGDPTYVCDRIAALEGLFCVRSCTTTDDCIEASSAFDADNFTCREKRCLWLGCNDDLECQETYGPRAWSCVE